MTATAIAMMVFSVAMLWGGLAFAVIHLLRSTPTHDTHREDVVRRIAQERDL